MLQDLVNKLKCKSESAEGIAEKDLVEVEELLHFLKDKYGECSLPEVQVAKQQVMQCRTQIELQGSFGHINHRTPRKVLKQLWKQAKELNMTNFKGFRVVDKLLYPELANGTPNVIRIIDGLRAQAGSSQGVSEDAIESLHTILKTLEEANLTMEDKSFRIASKLLSRVSKQLTIQNALAKVTVTTPLTAKQSLWNQGIRLGMENYKGMVTLRAILGDNMVASLKKKNGT